MKRKLISSVLLGVVLLWGTGLTASAATTYISPTLKAQLQYIVEEEKLARDVYTALAAQAYTPRFANIARAEQIHMNAAAAILKTYGIWNPTLNRASGVFYNKTLANLYTTLVAKGRVSAADAYAVGVLIEETDIADLAKMAKTTTQSDILFMINSLKAGSTNHLNAFSRY
ncbi:MAG: DUF2202 domain-containing protein [Candidatus Nanopelagicaceae bacterium]|nr:DUF2202 domain-containing protein [Candidatus Nanopelagicaceae bacterium]